MSIDTKNPLKVLFFTIDGHGLPVAYRLQQEGNYVFVGMVSDWKKTAVPEHEEDNETKKKRTSLYDGMFKYKMDADKLIKRAAKIKDKENYIALCDFNYLYPYADKLRKMGFKGLLPTKFDFELEKDRAKSKKLVEELYPNLAVADFWEFDKKEDAFELMDENPEMLFVLKGFKETAATVVPDSTIPEINHAEIKDALELTPEDYESEKFILEEKISDLIEFTPEAVSFDKKIVGTSYDIEAKDIGAGETGFQTGCAMDMIEWIDNKEIYDAFLKPLEKYMLRKNEMTIWDAAVAYSPSRNTFYFLEFCPNRWGFNAIFTELSTFTKITDYFRRIFNKEDVFQGNTKKFGASVRVFNMISGGKPAENSLISAKDTKNIWLWDVKKNKDRLRTVGLDKNLAIITAASDNLEEAVEKVYDTLKQDSTDFSWTGGLFRHDFLDDSYEASIINRYNIINELFDMD